MYEKRTDSTNMQVGKEDVQLDLDNKSGMVYGPQDNASIYVTIWAKDTLHISMTLA